MAKKPSKPKLAKYPKMPRAGASLQTLKAYQSKCAAVDARNREKISTYNKKLNDIQTAKKLYETLKTRKTSRKYPALKVA